MRLMDDMAMKLKYDGQGDATKRLLLETYGCQMNVADSEVVATVMKMAFHTRPVSAVRKWFQPPERFSTAWPSIWRNPP